MSFPASIQNLVVLTGAGISAESGLATFRASDGLWCNHRIEDVATPEAFARNPALVQDFYNMRRSQLQEVQPNAAHHALAKLAQHWPGRFLLVTQNVDNLHQRALAEITPAHGFTFHAMHGELQKARCLATEEVCDWHGDINAQTPCPCCNRKGVLRPHIVWFGEMPLAMEMISRHLKACDLFVSIGTSGNVYPAAGFVQEVKYFGHGQSVELNLEPSLTHSQFDVCKQGKATELVPAWVDEMLTLTKMA